MSALPSTPTFFGVPAYVSFGANSAHGGAPSGGRNYTIRHPKGECASHHHTLVLFHGTEILITNLLDALSLVLQISPAGSGQSLILLLN
jgi:hypothetical protein